MPAIISGSHYRQAVLCELGFMDNLIEAHLMTSETFIKECAEEIYLGILDYYNLGGK